MARFAYTDVYAHAYATSAHAMDENVKIADDPADVAEKIKPAYHTVKLFGEQKITFCQQLSSKNRNRRKTLHKMTTNDKSGQLLPQ